MFCHYRMASSPVWALVSENGSLRDRSEEEKPPSGKGVGWSCLIRGIQTILLSGATAMLFLAGVLPAEAGTPTESVKSTVDEVIRILSDERLKQPAQLSHRRKLLEQVVGRRFDYEELSKRALGAQWKKLNDAERQEFVDLFRSLITDTYAGRIESYSGEQVYYLKERLTNGYAEVQTKIVSPKVEASVDYRLLSKAGDWRVYDVVIEGVSLVRNYRGQFERILRESSYADLVDKLRKKSGEIQPPKPKPS